MLYDQSQWWQQLGRKQTRSKTHKKVEDIIRRMQQDDKNQGRGRGRCGQD